jgi:hypothetical protein
MCRHARGKPNLISLAFWEALMNVDPKVVAAISSAVGLYLQAEQETLLAQGQSNRRAATPVAMSSPFAMAGRQAAMNIRWTWQMRLPR